MMTPKEKADCLVFYYENLLAPFILDKQQLKQKATQCAIICCNEVLSDMGADRGYAFWSEVKYILDTNLKEIIT